MVEKNISQLFTEALQLASAGKADLAIPMLLEVIRREPTNVQATNILAMLLIQTGKYPDALKLMNSAVALLPNEPSFLLNIAIILQQQGRVGEAITHLLQAIQLSPNYIEAHINLSLAYEKIREIDKAIETARHIAGLYPQQIKLWEHLIALLMRVDRISGAIMVLFQALAFHPNNDSFSQRIARLLHFYKPPSIKDEWKPVLIQLCGNENVASSDISYSMTLAVKQMAAFPILLQHAKESKDIFAPQEPLIREFLCDSLVLAALPTILFRDEDCERLLVFLRKSILKKTADSDYSSLEEIIPHEFACAFARQCFFNEYVYTVSEEEEKIIENLTNTIEHSLTEGTEKIRSIESALAFYAMYKPLSTLKGFLRILDIYFSDWGKEFQPIIKSQILEVNTERELAKTIPSITAVQNETSLAVRRQYEENPYPRWVKVAKPPPIDFAQKLKKVFPNKNVTHLPKPIPVLVAGCGTGQEPISLSYQYNNAHILAVDLSFASLAYAKRKANELGVSNIEFKQGDILELRSLAKTFYLIECGGVLHHLRNPLEGWSVLVDLLHRDGIMNIALYSESARLDVREARKFLEGKGFSPNERGIQEARRAIMDLPNEHPAKKILLSMDFFTASTFRDLLMHVEEHQFTITKISQALKDLNLRFLGFELDPRLRSGFTKMFPEQEALLDIYKWKLFETKNPAAFVGMYSFWCCKK